MNEVEPLEAIWLVAEDNLVSVTELFHQINNLIPDDQTMYSIPPDKSVADAIQIMQNNGFSQLPVKSGNEVLGVFSYRSLATQVASIGKSKFNYGELPVEEFIEPAGFVSIRDDFESTFEYLDRDDAVLVGQENNLQGIVTAIDILRYLNEVTGPFVILREIELTLRRVISACISKAEIEKFIKKSNERLQMNKNLAEHYLLPSSLEDMSFKHYDLFISTNWPRFKPVFGETTYQKNKTLAKLDQIGKLRNDICHFRRELTFEDRITLTNHRFWLLSKARSFEAKRAATNESIN